MKNNPLESAKQQLLDIAKILELDKKTVDRLLKIENLVSGEISVKLDNGRIQKFKAWRSQHNSACGPYKGGIRFHEGVTVEEVQALSMWMTWKTAVVGIPYGGGKGGVVVNPKNLSKSELQRLSRAYIKLIAEHIGSDKDIPAPDVNTNAEIMGWMLDEYEKIVGRKEPGVLTGKPLELGGSKGRTEATGLGGSYVLDSFVKKLKKQKKNVSIAVQGFGNVGSYFAKFAYKNGYKIVAVSDSKNTLYNEKGLNIDKAFDYKAANDTFKGFPGGKLLPAEAVLSLNVDILVPAALENAVNEENVSKINARHILEMANGPVTPRAEEVLTAKKILILPDVLANAGGVVVSYFEWVQNLQNYYWEKEEVYAKLKKLMDKAFASVWSEFERLSKVSKKSTLRQAAYSLAVQKVVGAMKARGEN
ncbi:MAG: Glu/Leu/Phe/Val dehydrogenase [Patescibacteria group bacterium]|nr:Glu/Leu/Phe/Val dehydrogenase [Patescibacteria group bacterium]MCL5262055.1 Glu/Leu/Phe/Val dehydrogenase [Patescibacteria group bacterium]